MSQKTLMKQLKAMYDQKLIAKKAEEERQRLLNLPPEKFEAGTNFEGMQKRDPEEFYLKRKGSVVECPKCKGYGGWNHQRNGLNSYWQAHCFQCEGWGVVPAESKDATCVHTYKELSVEQAREKKQTHFGKCWHVYECTQCGNFKSVDSSG